MGGRENRTDTATRSTIRKAFSAIFRRSDEPTIIEECRRCGTTLESTISPCPSCGCRDIVEYRIE
ncbi:hypothetical protein [Natrinema ejinorense]|uniref:Rubrerythrin-like domain-containing protein n=1 Tax=Natrinema ejinorense TaxID=373386 RepID=A0A2A5QTL2_9EURY|nr:hypothetical protein [Natrinema ejinorense]PCR90187.1 hypothetical protein CP557_06300 [Natrinema ejinorense]